MAKSNNNVITHGLSGKIGDLLVFRQHAGRTIVSKVPQRTKEDSEKQKAHKKRFQRAVLYAKSALTDQDTKNAYAAAAGKGLTAYNVAVADMLNAPDIDTVDLSEYTGQIGDAIRIHVTDDFMVKEVKLVITNADGSLVEEGFAQLETDGYLWVYKASCKNDSLDGDKIEIIASDLPGNTTIETKDI